LLWKRWQGESAVIWRLLTPDGFSDEIFLFFSIILYVIRFPWFPQRQAMGELQDKGQALYQAQAEFRHLKETPPGKEWDRTWIMKSK
jgi:hypothetical protein